MKVDTTLSPPDLLAPAARLWQASAEKIESIQRTCTPAVASPVFTVAGRYTARGWTEWTRGFQYGSALLQYDATGDERYLELGRAQLDRAMANHLTHTGVHDHGFHTVSSYGALWRLACEGRVEANERDPLALRVSGAVQAARWRPTADGAGYIYSFNGPHSLFVDTIRSLRALALAHRLGQELLAEHDERVSLLARLIGHAHTTARYNIYYGDGRDAYDVRGRTAHEAIFNTTDGRFRCPSTQQGYSPFSTWTRGLAWAMLGFSEQLEFLDVLDDAEFDAHGGRAAVTDPLFAAARATCDFYLDAMPSDGIPYWDTGAPGLAAMPDHRDRPADPFNPYEPVDSSAAAIAAQGLLRLGHYLRRHAGDNGEVAGDDYWQAGLTIAATLLEPPYLSLDPRHQGLLLHSVYHRPNGWDHIPPGHRVPNGEASMWGDYHLRELALYLQRLATGGTYLTFFGPADGAGGAAGGAA